MYSVGKQLLSYIVNKVIPEFGPSSVTDEEEFKKILDWCDVWIVLLATTGKHN